MKQVVFTAILILTFCFAVFAQANERVDSTLQSTPKLLTSFNDTDNEWYKLTADYIVQGLLDNPSAIGLVRIKNDGEKKLARRLHMIKQGAFFRGIELNRITFLIVDKQEHDTDVLVASSCSEMPKCEECIVIRAIDIDKIGKLFRPKTTIKKAKKK